MSSSMAAASWATATRWTVRTSAIWRRRGRGPLGLSAVARVATQMPCNNSVANAILPGLTNDRSAAALGAIFGGLTGANGGTIAADGSNINPVALNLLNLKVAGGGFLIPTPQRATILDPQGGPQGTSAFSIPSKFNEDQYIVNVDFLRRRKITIPEKCFY